MDLLRFLSFSLCILLSDLVGLSLTQNDFVLDEAKANIPFFRNLFERIKAAKEEKMRKMAAGEFTPQSFPRRTSKNIDNTEASEIVEVVAPSAQGRDFFQPDDEGNNANSHSNQDTDNNQINSIRQSSSIVRLQPVDPDKPPMTATLSHPFSSLTNDAVDELAQKASAFSALSAGPAKRPRKKKKKTTTTTTTAATTQAANDYDYVDTAEETTTLARTKPPVPRRSAGQLSAMENLGEQKSVVVGKQANALEHLTRKLVDKFGITSDQIRNVLPLIPVSQTIKQDCLTEAEGSPKVPLDDPFSSSLPECARTKYRSFDGTCNNIAFPNRGTATSIFLRMIEPDYADSIGAPRKSKRGLTLPSARLISKQVAGNSDSPASDTSVLFMQFGQFIDHDVTNTPKSRGIDKLPPQCCFDNDPKHALDPACFPIPIPADDKFMAPLNQTCMEFVRSLPGTRPGCTLGPREQVNQNTAFIDGSAIYGGSQDKADFLRTMSDGAMKTFAPKNDPHYDLLPQNAKNSECIDPSDTKMCFRAGDVRVNVHLGIAEIQTLWVRQHNVVARKLAEVNPHWDDDKLFQETRHIVVAQLQHVTYNEFLPVLLGEQILDKWKLRVLDNGRSNGYDITVHPGILNEFATAAYRFGHTMVPNEFRRASEKYQFRGTERLKSSFFHPFALYDKNAFDEVIFGMVSSPAQEVDVNFVDDLTNHLFEIPGDAFGLDLTALNIQRGRDHGIAGWMRWRQLCGLPTATTFEELKAMQIMDAQFVDKMSDAYDDLADVDLYLAGSAENHVPGGKLGPTFACIIADQFRRLKFGDRFWFENDLPLSSSLSDKQVQAMRGITMSRILCDNTPLMEAVQPKAFLMPSSNNKVISCDSIPDFDYKPWKVRRKG